MNYIELHIPRCRLCLTQDKILTMLKKDPELFQAAVKRGKGIIRSEQQKVRLEKKRREQTQNENIKAERRFQ